MATTFVDQSFSRVPQQTPSTPDWASLESLESPTHRYRGRRALSPPTPAPAARSNRVARSPSSAEPAAAAAAAGASAAARAAASTLGASASSGDRFIRSRLNFDVEVANYNLRADDALVSGQLDTSPAKEQYKRALNTQLLGGRARRGVLLEHGVAAGSRFGAAARGGSLLPALASSPAARARGASSNAGGADEQSTAVPTAASALADDVPLRLLDASAPVPGASSALRAALGGSPRRQARVIPRTPLRILDAPEMLEDYYLNLLDWSAKNVMAVALNRAVYLWNAASGAITKLYELRVPDGCITSLRWTESGDYLAIGTSESDVQLWDVRSLRKVRTLRGHNGRVSVLAWHHQLLASGSRDANVHIHDVRARAPHTQTLSKHTQEVCGLAWSDDGILASGGNDNLVSLWEPARSQTPRHVLSHHTAAVKGLAWCPWQRNLLASGGGTADRTIRFWDASNGACLNAIDTKSQVCSIMWSRNQRELVSSHGFSLNQICVWSYPDMVKVCELTGHTSRVLHLAMSPDGETVCSASGDETLRFWKLFERRRPSSVRSDGFSARDPSPFELPSVRLR